MFAGYYGYEDSPSAGYSNYGTPRPTKAAEAAVGRPQTTLLVQLSVELIEDAPVSAAKEFMEALVKNL